MKLHLVAVVLFGLAVAAEKVRITRVDYDDDQSNYNLGERNKRDTESMPMKITYELVTESGDVVMLRLTKVDRLVTTIIKKGRSRTFRGNEPNLATYTDIGRDGVFLIGRYGSSNQLVGQFQMGPRYVTLDPDPEFRDMYLLTDEDPHVDFTDDGIDIPAFPTVYANGTSNTARALKNYIVEIAFFADNSIYSKFLLKNNNDASSTNTEMSIYYAFMAEQLKVRYKHVTVVDPSISIVLVISGLVIYTDPADIGFVEDHVFDVNCINSSVVLDKFKDYIDAPPAAIAIPPSDHYMLFTGYDLVSASTGSKSNAGLAYTKSICDGKYATSLVEDSRNEIAAITAAHELGHGLGAQHDAIFGCNDTDQFIMTTSFGSTTSTAVAKRRWQFSTCSVSQFKTNLAAKTCLNDNRYGTGEFAASPKLGQLYSKDQQCKFAVHDQSSHYIDVAGEECFRMKCFINSTSLRYVIPLDYSDCETDKWCVHGECVAKPSTDPPVNSPPTITNLPQTVDVPAATQGSFFTVAATDSEGDPISFSHKWTSPTNAENYFVFDDLTGQVSVKPGITLDYQVLQNIVFTVVVTATDEQGASPSQTLTINVTSDPNTPPVINPSSNTISLPHTQTGTVFTFSSTDAESDPITYSSVSWNPSDGINYFQFNTQTGEVSVRTGVALPPNTNFTLTVTATDGQLTSNTGILYITVQPAPNTAPVINPPFSSITVPTTKTGTVSTFSATDAESNLITYSVASWNPITGTNYFQLNQQTGEVSVKSGATLPPDSNFTLTVTATDGQLTSTSAILQITVQPAPNTAPVITPSYSTISVPSTKTGTLFNFSTTDAESDSITYNAASWTPTTGTNFFQFNTQTGEVSVRPNVIIPPDTSYLLLVRATDGQLSSNSAGLQINVASVPNTAPLINPSFNTITVHPTKTGTVFTFSATDAESDPITYSVASWNPQDGINYFQLNTQTGEVSVRTGVTLPPDSNFTLTVTATDGQLTSTAGILQITVQSAQNTAPVINPSFNTLSVPASETGTVFTFSATDAESDPITYSVTGWNPSTGTNYFQLNTQTGVVSVRPGATLPPDSSFLLFVTATDGQLPSNAGGLKITVEPVPNRPPTVDNLDATISVQEGSPGVVFTVIGSDLDNDQITFSFNWISPANAGDFFIGSPTTGAISVRNGIVLPPNEIFIVDIHATDGQALSSVKTLTINTTPTSNTVPQFTNLPETKLIAENPTGVVYTVSATDNENHPIQYTGTWSPIWATFFFSFDGTTGEVSALPNAGLTYQNFKDATFTLSVIASDNMGGSSAPADLNIRISEPNPTNSPPVLSNTAYFAYPQSTQAGTNVFRPLTNDVTDQDVGDTKTFSIQNSQYSNYFKINSVTGEITFSQNYPSTLPQQVLLTVEVRDRLGALDTALLIVAIPEIYVPLDLPNLPAEISVPEGTTPQTVIYTVRPPLVNNVPVSVTYTLSQSPATSPSPIFAIHPTTGLVSYVGNSVLDYETLPVKNFTLSVTATDTNGASTSDNLLVAVTNVNEPPQFTQIVYGISVNGGPIGQTVINSLLSSINDPDVNDVISFQMLSDPNSQYFTIDPSTGRISYAVDYIGPGFPSPVTIRVLARDSGGLETTAIFTIDIQRIQNQVPYFSNLPNTISLPSSQASSVAFFTASGRDDDANSVLTYRIDNPSSSFPQVLFTINPSNGQVSLINGVSLAFIPPQTFDLMVSVSDGTATTTKALTISITSIQNQPPVFNPDSHVVNVVEGQAGKVVMSNLSGFVTDPNTGDSLTYSINPSSQSQYFQIDPVTGIITFSVDYFLNSRPNYVALSVTVTDSGGLTDTAIVNVLIKQSDTLPPQFSNDPYFAVISRLTLPGSTVFTVTATGESGANLEYSLVDGMGIFAINRYTGGVTIEQSVDLTTFVPNITRKLRVVVTDGLTSTETILTVVIF